MPFEYGNRVETASGVDADGIRLGTVHMAVTYITLAMLYNECRDYCSREGLRLLISQLVHSHILWLTHNLELIKLTCT